MNDEVEAATTLILNGPPGSEIGTVGFDQPDLRDGDRLWNLAPLIPEAALLPSVPTSHGTHRPHLREPLPRDRNADDRRHDRRRRTGNALDRGQPDGAPGRAGLGSCRDRGDVRLLASSRGHVWWLRAPVWV